jgi:hypothetical protein
MNEHPAETSRQPASAYLFIDSQDRFQISSLGPSADINTVLVALQTGNARPALNNFIIQKRQPFLSGYFTRLAVTECRFEYNSPNVNPRNNKIVFYDSAAVEHVITVPEGFYTPDELAAELDTLLTAAIPGQTWQVDYTKDCQFEIESDENFQISPGDNWATVDQMLRSLFFMMNFNLADNYNPALVQTGSPFPSMTYTRYIDICSRQLTQYQKVKDNSTRENQVPGVLCRLYLGNYTTEGLGDGGTTANLYFPGCRPCVLSRIFNVPKYASWNPGAFIDQIDIELRDDIGNLLYIGGELVEGQNAIYNNNEFQLTLHASES